MSRVLTPPTNQQLRAMSSALDATLERERFEDGKFDGTEREAFVRALQWVSGEQIERMAKDPEYQRSTEPRQEADMLPLGIIIGTYLTGKMGWRYAVVASVLVAAAQALDAAYGPQVGGWLAKATRSVFQ